MDDPSDTILSSLSWETIVKLCEDNPTPTIYYKVAQFVPATDDDGNIVVYVHSLRGDREVIYLHPDNMASLRHSLGNARLEEFDFLAYFKEADGLICTPKIEFKIHRRSFRYG